MNWAVINSQSLGTDCKVLSYAGCSKCWNWGAHADCTDHRLQDDECTLVLTQLELEIWDKHTFLRSLLETHTTFMLSSTDTSLISPPQAVQEQLTKKCVKSLVMFSLQNNRAILKSSLPASYKTDLEWQWTAGSITHWISVDWCTNSFGFKICRPHF